MYQKDVNLRVIECLLKAPNHVRGLAVQVGTNQTTIARKVKELEGQNVVDHKMQGKNKVVFLKKTLEAKQLACMSELGRVVDAVRLYPRLRLIVGEIRKDSRISLAVVFGSVAKKSAGKSSDIDLFIETADQEVKRSVELLDSRLSVKIGLYEPKSLLIKEIEKWHLVVKGCEEFYEKHSAFQ